MRREENQASKAGLRRDYNLKLCTTRSS
jgi:hypothetical protein